MFKRWQILTMLFVAAALGFWLRAANEPAHADSSQGSVTGQARSRLDLVRQRGKLIVGTYSTSPPVAYIDKHGDLVGFEIEMARAIAKDLLGDPSKVEF